MGFMVKNRSINRVKISGQKFSFIVRCFSADTTAAACAKIVKINPKTADLYYQYFRQLVLEYQEEERREFLSEEGKDVDEAYFGSTGPSL